MSRREIPTYTVICNWLDTTRTYPDPVPIAVVVQHPLEPRVAGSDAALALVRYRGGEATALFVIEGEPKLHRAHGNWFECVDGITFLGQVKSIMTLQPFHKRVCPACKSLAERTLTWKCCGSDATSQGCWDCGYVSYPPGITAENWQQLMREHSQA